MLELCKQVWGFLALCQGLEDLTAGIFLKVSLQVSVLNIRYAVWNRYVHLDAYMAARAGACASSLNERLVHNQGQVICSFCKFISHLMIAWFWLAV